MTIDFAMIRPSRMRTAAEIAIICPGFMTPDKAKWAREMRSPLPANAAYTLKPSRDPSR